ncbi:deoxycytidylate deaminase-like [Sycon ciliatum]|uniref:deoxycytidylate deaminase-like n=1 Tax=Sycon ciliatum TaxID=27933 RepID=UPI0020A9071D|eukprot:scpid85453/ scgid25281/ Deoxycytidylate deaminase; dCMP deaminase
MSSTPTKRPAEAAGLCVPAKICKLSDENNASNSVSKDCSLPRNLEDRGDCQLPDKFPLNAFSPCVSSQSQGQTTAASAVASKRDDYLSWSDYFMAVAFLSAQRSKDPNSQVGACIVNSENKIVGIGYNGMPNGCSDDELPWSRTAEDKLDTKYPYVCHAEMNAIMNKNSADVKGCTIYVALFPCNECAKLIIQSGIQHVIYMSDKYFDRPEFIASRRLLTMAGIECSKFVPKTSRLVIDFNSI